MSERKPQTETQSEVSSGWLSLEAKAGLTLICLLAAAFSYMVWQKWKEMENGSAKAEVVETNEKPKKDLPDPQEVNQQPELELVKPDGPFGGNNEPETVTLSSDENTNGSLPPTLNLGAPDNEPTADDNPFANLEPEQPERRPANIPTLDELNETDSNTIAENSDYFDPLGDKPEPAVNTDSASTAEMARDDEFNPFGPPEENTGSNSAGLPDDTKVDPATNNPVRQAPEQEPDPFVTAPDPFTEPPKEAKPEETPTLEFTESETERGAGPQPVTTAETGPFGEPESQSDPFKEPAAPKHPLSAKTVNAVNDRPGDAFREPLPLLEPVPEKPSKPAEHDPFGEFESVPAGAAQASSVTQVSPGPSQNLKRSGTLAELNAPAAANLSTNRDPSRIEENPFSNVQPQPRPVSVEFKLNPDGTYEVRQGDSYWIISRKAYGSSRYYRALAEYNRNVIGDPLQMKAGKKIRIPPVQELELKLSRLIPETPAAPPPSIVMASAEQEAGFFTDDNDNPMYRVQQNDTLTQIAQRHLGRSSRWIQIYELNRDRLSNPNQLKIGTILKLPGDASRVRIVRGQ